MSGAKVTDLSDRMVLYSAGQVTWPEPSLKRKCADCRLFVRHRLSAKKWKEGRGHCKQVANMSLGRQWGVDFPGSAIACPKFDAR